MRVLTEVAAQFGLAFLGGFILGLAPQTHETMYGGPKSFEVWRREMPFKSKAQRRKFAELLVQGKISDQTFEEWNRETGGRKLPERVTPPRPPKSRRRKTARKRKAR